MIQEFSVRPMPKNRNARYAFFALLGAATVTVIVSYFLSSYKGVIQLASLLLLVAAVLVYTRYVGSTYYYEVAFAGETPIFLVSQVTGRRRSALCRVNLCDVIGIETLTGAEYRAYKPESGMKRYNYTPTLGPSEVHLMRVRSRMEKADVFLELSEEFRALLLSYAEEARAIRTLEDED